MPQRKETISELIHRLEEEASVIRHEERKDNAHLDRDIRIKELDKEIARIRVEGEVQKVKLTHKWESVSHILTKLLYLPVLVLLTPFVGVVLLRGKALPKWLDDLIKK